MRGQYARKTAVPVEKSKAEIEKELVSYGATGFSSAWSGNMARIEFVLDGRHIRMNMQLPNKDDESFTLTDTGRKRKSSLANVAWEQGCRSLWRDLKLIIKAKLEAIIVGISTVDREFMPDVMLSDGKTVGEHILPKIDDVYNGGSVKGLLPEFKQLGKAV